MNKTIVALVAFLCGGGVGYLIANKILDEKYAQLAQEEIDSVKETFMTKQMKEYMDNDVETTQKLVESFNGMTEEEYEAKNERTNKMPLVRNSISEGQTDGAKTRTPYSDMAKEELKEKWKAQSQDEEPVVDAGGFYEGDHVDHGGVRDLSNVDRTAPYLISDREYTDEFPHHDKVSLYYYLNDDVLTGEDEEVIDEIDDTVGWDALGLLDTQTTAWVRNERLEIDYEICLVRGAFAQVRHGAGVGPALSPRERHLKDMKRRAESEE